MRLFNKTIDRQLFKQYALGSDLSKQEVVVKIFNPYSNGTWFILNSDPNDPDYLWAIVDLGYGAEVGSVSRSDLETYRGRFGLGFERDLSFDPVNALELYQGLRRGEYYAKGGGVGSSEENTFDKIFLHYGFTKKRGAYGVRPYEHKKLGTYAQIDDKTRSVEIETPDDEYKGGYSVKGVIEFLKSKGFEETGSYADGGQIEVVYERRADFKKKPIKLLLLSRGREQKGYTFSGKDQVAVLDNYNRNKQEDLEKLWNLKGYETKYADGGEISSKLQVLFEKMKNSLSSKNFNYFDKLSNEVHEISDTKGLTEKEYEAWDSLREKQNELRMTAFLGKSKFADGGELVDYSDNQLMVMNQNVEVEHHHEELEDILEDKVPVPAWVVAKMETATQNLSDITHYLDGQKELMEDENEDENEEEDEDQDEIENKIVVEPIDVSAGTKTDLTKNFTDEAWGNLRGFLKGMEGVDLRDDYTFDYKDEQYEVEPIINSDENGVSNAVFTIFDGDGEEVGDVAYSRDGGKQKFTANSEFFSWNNAKFEDGGFMNGVYADGGEISLWKAEPNNKPEKLKTFKSLRAYNTYMNKNRELLSNEHFKNGTGFFGFEADATQKEVESSIENLYDSNNQYADGGYFDGTIPKASSYMSNYAKGGEVAKAEILGLKRNFMGTTDVEMKISGMRKPQSFIVYPISKDDSGDIITIQSETRIGKIDLSSGRGLMSQSHSNGAYFVHFQMDKLTPFTISESDLEDLKMQIFKTAGDNVGSRGIVSDNSGASRLFSHGGENEEGVDLFEDYDNIPPKLQAVLDKYEYAFQDGDYRDLEKALKAVNAIGYTFEYYLDGQAYDLRKIGQKGKSEVEKYAKGGGIDYHKFYEVSASTKNGYDLYKINGIEDQDVFIANYKSLKEANQAGEKLGLEKRPMWLRYGKGGVMSNFDKLSAKVAKNYEGKPVQGKYQEEYGKVYSKAEAKEVGDKVAGKMKAMTADKKAFGGLFGGAKSLVSSKKYPQLEGKQVMLKSGKMVNVFEQSGDTLSVLELGKFDSGERPYSINISEVDMTSFKLGGETKKRSGSEMLKQANVLAKKIRKDGESWNDAKKRAFAQLKK